MSIDFTNPEQFHELEKQAYQGTLDYDEFPPCEYKYFARLCQVYYAFRFEGLLQGEAERAKKLIFRQYQQELQDYQYYTDFVKRWHANIRNAGSYRDEILKTSDTVEKYILAVKCVGAMTGDEVFVKTALEQMKGASS